MSEPFVAEIRIMPYGYAPRGWAFCDGQALPVAQNSALFSLLGDTYGGDQRTIFYLPDLRGRAPMHPGQSRGGSPYTLGQSSGEAQVTLTEGQLPVHSHAVTGDASNGKESAPGGKVLAQGVTPERRGNITPQQLYSGAAPGTAMHPQMVGTAGTGAPHENRQPWLGVNFCVALQGIYPPRP